MLRRRHIIFGLLCLAGPAMAQDMPGRASCTLDLFCPGDDETCGAADPVSFGFDSDAGRMTLGGETLEIETVMGDSAGLVLISVAATDAPLVHAALDPANRVMVIVSSDAGDGMFRSGGRYLGNCEGS